METEQTPAQSETPAQDAAPAVNEGVQKRIDQLTAKIHERDAQIMEFQQKLLETAMRTPPAAPVAPAVEIDPLAQFNGQLDDTVAKAVRAATEAVTKKFEGLLSQQQSTYASQMAELQVHSYVANLGVEVPQEVKARAAAIAKQHGTSPDVAFNLAYGEYALAQQKKVASVKGYTPPSTPVLTGGAPAPAPIKGPARPANFDQLDPIKQYEYLEANGFEDSEL